MGDPTHAQRREFLEAHVPVHRVAALEIGAADLPTYRPDEIDVRFLDVQPSEDLVAQYSRLRTRDSTGVVPVDYVTDGRPLRDCVDRRFSMIMAHHVIEHVPDTIGWLDELAHIATEDAVLFLAIPDRRYTFDYVRRETDLVDLLRARAERRSAPDFYVLLRNAYYYRPIRAPDAWQGRIPELVGRRRFTLRQAIAHARSGREKDADMHCHVFTHDSFLALWRELEDERLVGWRLKAARDVAPGGNEFVVLLERDTRSYDPDPLA